MGYEQYSNPASTTLSGNGGSITSGATAFNVADGTSFPSANFRLLIGAELIFVGARASNALSACVRGIEGTAAASHADGAAADHILTAQSLLLTSPYRGVRQPPAASAFATWVDQSTSTLTDDRGTLVLAYPGTTGGTQVRGAYKGLPATPFVVTLGVLCTLLYVNYRGGGLSLRRSSDGKLITLGAWSDNVVRLRKLNGSTSFNADYLTFAWNFSGGPMWWRIADDGTTRTWSYSIDGTHFVPFATNGHADFMTADQVGMFGNADSSSSAESNYVTAFHYEEA
jgi:hypothetical protein